MITEEHIDIIKKAHKGGVVKKSALLVMFLFNRRRRGWVIKDIIKHTGLSAQDINGIKKELVKADIIREHVPDADKRKTKLYLTSTGRLRAQRLWEKVEALVGLQNTLSETLPPGQED